MVEARTILLNAATALQDQQDHIRWPLPELWRYLQDGLRDLARPERAPQAFTELREHPLVAGAVQQIPDAYAVLEVKYNVVGGQPSSAIRPVALAELDRFDAGWYQRPATTQVKNYGLDPFARNAFWVYPPNDGNGRVAARIARLPEALTPLNNGETLDDYAFALEIDEAFSGALTYYVLARAWAKDADFAANQQNTNRYHALYLEALGLTGGDR